MPERLMSDGEVVQRFGESTLVFKGHQGRPYVQVDREAYFLDCPTCVKQLRKEMAGPTHYGSRMCESGGATDTNPGGRSHCSCDRCF